MTNPRSVVLCKGSGIAALVLLTAIPASRVHGQLSERVACSLAASLKFGVPANVVLAVAQLEGGRPGQAIRNRNGTFDVGTMQLNSAYVGYWLPRNEKLR